MTDQDKIIAELVKKARDEDWPEHILYAEIWAAAVEWAGGLVDYSTS